MLKSYYQILNVREDAKKSEIKAQYRKMVRMYHPDINSSLEAEIIFKEINKAAEVLLDNEKRKRYDALRSTNKTVFKQNKDSSNYTFSDLFKKDNKQEIKKPPRPKDGEDIFVSVTIDFSEAMFGTTRVINIARSSVCPKCGGRKFANGIKCNYCGGLGEKTEAKKITVKIPPAIKNKAKLRLKGEGQQGQNGGKPGNLYVEVNVEKCADFEIKDNIVYHTAEITPYLAVLGGSLTVPTLWGETTIKIPPLTKANQRFKLIDVGVLNEKTDKKGEQIVTVTIQIPSKLSDEETALYQKLREINLKKKNATTLT